MTNIISLLYNIYRRYNKRMMIEYITKRTEKNLRKHLIKDMIHRKIRDIRSNTALER